MERVEHFFRHLVYSRRLTRGLFHCSRRNRWPNLRAFRRPFKFLEVDTAKLVIYSSKISPHTVLDFLTNATYAPPSRISCRLLKLILCCCTGFDHTLHLQIIKMLCVSLNSGRMGYFFSDSEATLTESPILTHCKRYSIGAEELTIIMSIGAIIVGSLELLPPNSFSDMLQAAVFTDKFMILAILKYQVPEPASAVLLQSALVCLFYSRFRKDLLWPSLHDVDFYTELTQCLHNIIMDPSEPASRFLAIRVYDALLEKVAAADNIIGGDFILTNPWNGIVLEQLQFVAPQDELSYPSIFLLQFVTALVKTDDPRILLIVDKKLLVDLLQLFVHGTNECLPNVMLSLRQLAEELSRANNLGLISNIEKVSLREKLRMEAAVGQLTSPMDVFLTQQFARLFPCQVSDFRMVCSRIAEFRTARYLTTV
ncbi:hypothetical protein CSKR_105085 [Clonorchis sinensis]|uniref:Uncharacterized protein n=1 Tax=Clonorchis sinensis TaxID=79923 RepID=A0A3R7GFP9_CLOSI|nr:hypothetical protein CSKR_105085 [Clonorchis sinensis]